MMTAEESSEFLEGSDDAERQQQMRSLQLLEDEEYLAALLQSSPSLSVSGATLPTGSLAVRPCSTAEQIVSDLVASLGSSDMITSQSKVDDATASPSSVSNFSSAGESNTTLANPTVGGVDRNETVTETETVPAPLPVKQQPLPTLEECLYGRNVLDDSDRDVHDGRGSVSKSLAQSRPQSEQELQSAPASNDNDAEMGGEDGVEDVSLEEPRKENATMGRQRRRPSQQDQAFLRPPGLWKLEPYEIDLQMLRRIASQGLIPEEGSHRALAWRVLFGYLSPNNREWEARLQEKRNDYMQFVSDLFNDVGDVVHGQWLRGRRRTRQRSHRGDGDSIDEEEGSAAATQRFPNYYDDDEEEASVDDVPKSEGAWNGPSSSNDAKLSSESLLAPKSCSVYELKTIPQIIKQRWKRYGRDLQLLEYLAKGINFFKVDDLANLLQDDTLTQEDLEQPWKDFMESATLLDQIRKDVVRTQPFLSFFLDPTKNLGKRRYAALERILFVWSKYNKGVQYVQGMNEIVGTLYYVMANDWNEEWASHAEADTYWLFNSLVSEMRDVFMPDLDTADTGIQGRIRNMQTLLDRHDPEVKDHLEDIGIDPSYFAIRWWTTLLCREFLLPDTIRLWDSMLASTHKDNFLRYVCVTMVMVIRDELLKSDFSICLRLLQSYPSTHMDDLLESSRALWIYETQITVACHRGGLSLHQAMQAIPPPPAIIMAFGLRRGIAPLTRVEKFEQVSEKAAATVRDATSAVASSATVILGRASRLYSKYSQEVRSRYSSQALTKDTCSNESTLADFYEQGDGDSIVCEASTRHPVECSPVTTTSDNIPAAEAVTKPESREFDFLATASRFYSRYTREARNIKRTFSGDKTADASPTASSLATSDADRVVSSSTTAFVVGVEMENGLSSTGQEGRGREDDNIYFQAIQNALCEE